MAAKIHKVYSIQETATDGVLIFDVDRTADIDGAPERARVKYGYVPGDMFGMAPLLAEWLDANPGAVRKSYTPDLQAEKANAVETIDRQAEAARGQYITGGAGQAMVYQEKQAEMFRYDADGAPLKENYPLMAAEIGITADTLQGVADAVRKAYNAWRVKGAEIEGVRIRAKDRVKSSTTVDAIRAAVPATWP